MKLRTYIFYLSTTATVVIKAVSAAHAFFKLEKACKKKLPQVTTIITPYYTEEAA